LKYFNVYGPREEHKGRMASVAFHSFNQIKSAGFVKLFQSHKPGIPDGGQQRDFVFVEDAVMTTRHFLDTKATKDSPNGVYNCGTGVARSFADLAKAVFLALKLEPRIEYIPMPEDLRGKYQYFTQASTAKRVRAGVNKPFHSIEAGVEKYVRYLEAKG
jgi:ADP-L-glycero-D-manno-heptose 6-epimerase